MALADDPWLTLREAGVYAGVHYETLRRWIASGFLRGARIGVGKKSIRVRKSWVDEAMTAAGTPLEVKR